jgi:hypothetical protein
MKLSLAVCFSAVALTFSSAGFSQEAKPASNAKAEAPDKAPTTIPSNAVLIEPGAYRWTDAKGKKWILFQTPFGIARKEDTGEPLRHKKEDVETMQGVKITDAGDTLKFERQGPFGTYKWDKKKTDLTEAEKTAWEEQKSGQPVGSSAAGKKAESQSSNGKSANGKQDR